MKGQKQLILEKDWDILIVLDACRYDFFKDIYQDYLNGEVVKVRSRGSETREWLRNTFLGEEKMDVTYYSANPYINPFDNQFSASKCFENIEPLHLNEWDEEKGTVRPEVFPKVYDKKDSPAILHYMQPHEPYLNLEGYTGLVWDNEPGEKGLLKVIKEKIGPTLRNVLGEVRFRNLGKFISGRTAVNRIEKIISEKGILTMVKAYEYNLRKALESVKKVMENNEDKKIVVTADHGEAFGESGYYGHPSGAKLQILRNVLWMVID